MHPSAACGGRDENRRLGSGQHEKYMSRSGYMYIHRNAIHEFISGFIFLQILE